MARITEDIAILILEALKQEWERNQSHLTCPTEAAILGPVKSKYKLEDADINRGMNFLVNRQMVAAVNRKDGRA